MGDSNSKIPVSSIFDPVSTPAHEINVIALFSIGITAVIFVIVGGLLTYAIVRFRRHPGDDDREPPQVYGSNPIEFAWTTVPVLIVLVLFLTTARTIYQVQAPTRPPGAMVVGVPLSRPRRRHGQRAARAAERSQKPDADISRARVRRCCA
jgi:cytochrome c oxidase subunit 2